jgi:hypothetical protein
MKTPSQIETSSPEPREAIMDRTLQFSRRGMLSGTAATFIMAGSAGAQNDSSPIPPFARTGDSMAQDRAFWHQVAAYYDVDRSIAPFRVTSPLDRTLAEVSTGFDVWQGSNFSLRLSYDGRFGSHTTDNGGALELRAAF